MKKVEINKITWKKKAGEAEKYDLFINGVKKGNIEKREDFYIYLYEPDRYLTSALTLKVAKQYLLTKVLGNNQPIPTMIGDTDKFQDYIEKGRREGFSEGSEFAFGQKYDYFNIIDHARKLRSSNIVDSDDAAIAEAFRMCFGMKPYFSKKL